MLGHKCICFYLVTYNCERSLQFEIPHLQSLSWPTFCLLQSSSLDFNMRIIQNFVSVRGRIPFVICQFEPAQQSRQPPLRAYYSNTYCAHLAGFTSGSSHKFFECKKSTVMHVLLLLNLVVFVSTSLNYLGFEQSKAKPFVRSPRKMGWNFFYRSILIPLK